MVDDTMAIAHEHRQPPWPERTPSSTEKTAMKTATPSRTCTPRLRHQRRRNGRVAGLRGVLSGSTLLCCQRRPPARQHLVMRHLPHQPHRDPNLIGTPGQRRRAGSEEEPATSMMSCRKKGRTVGSCHEVGDCANTALQCQRKEGNNRRDA